MVLLFLLNIFVLLPSSYSSTTFDVRPRTIAWEEKESSTGDILDNCAIHFNEPTVRNMHADYLWINSLIQTHYKLNLPVELQQTSRLNCKNYKRVYVLYEVQLKNSKVLSLAISAKWSTGRLEFGKAPDILFPLVIDLQKKRVLTLKDLFKQGSDFSKVVNSSVCSRLSSKERLRFKGIQDISRFYLRKSGITFVFSSDELTTISKKVTVPYSELSNLLTENGAWNSKGLN